MDLHLDEHPSFSCCPWSCLFGICAITVFLYPGGGMGMQLTSTGPQTVQVAQGERVTLGCTYTSEPGDTGDLDIEWSMISPDATQKDQLLLSYAGGIKYVHGTSGLTKGLDFATDDPSLGNASLTIASLSPAHSATYQCKVKKSPGVDMRKVSLVVLVRPSVPKCWLEGEEVVGEDISLRCNSSQGSTPLNYAWRRDTGPIPATATQNHVTGVLSISNHSEGFAGIYTCEVTNAVGDERCTIKLTADKPANRAGVIIGTVVGCLLLIIIVAILIWLVLYKWDARFTRYEKEVSNDIREDVPAPESRPHSRGTSLRSGVAYSLVGMPQTEQSDQGRTPIPSTSSGFANDSRNGYAV
ncbi:V-set and immunoglobulin domain-containing protein 8a [Esox lucius]|uniref:Ig-like domain-containing protein n=1 Tax=Esox lucius TaxID=8010 RepID=A0A3P9ABC4_ESOLU|nr:V-set and immunoglobulin domain-containing protein 8a [Esox lucius]